MEKTRCKKWIIILSSLCLLGCKQPLEKIEHNEKRDYQFGIESFNDGIYIETAYDVGGIKFVDLGTGKRHPFPYHQEADDPTNNPINIGVVTYYQQKVLYPKIMDEGAYLSIYTCDLDGTHEEEIARYEKKDQIVVSSVTAGAIIQDHLILLIQQIDFKSGGLSDAIIRLDLASKQLQEMVSGIPNSGGGTRLAFVDQNKLYFQVNVDLDTKQFIDTNRLYALDVKQGTIEVILQEWDYYITHMFTVNHDIVYLPMAQEWKSQSPLHYATLNLSTHEIKEEVIDLPNHENIEYGFKSVMDDRIYLSQYANGENVTSGITIYYPETKTVEEYTLDEVFVPLRENTSQYLGVMGVDLQNYHFSIMTKEAFEQNDFSQIRHYAWEDDKS